MLAHIKQFLLDVIYQRVHSTEFILNIIRKFALNNFVVTKVFVLNSSYLVLLEHLFQKILMLNNFCSMPLAISVQLFLTHYLKKMQ